MSNLMWEKVKTNMEHLANEVTYWAGSVWSCIVAALLILAWAVTGPMYGYSDTWQLVANTFTTLVTFLMVFLIQNTQNRETKALHLKINEIILAMKQANNAMIGIEDLTEDQIMQLSERYKDIIGIYHNDLHKS